MLLRTLLLVLVAEIVVVGLLIWGARYPAERYITRALATREVQDALTRLVYIVGPEDMDAPIAGDRLDEVDRLVRYFVLEANIRHLSIWNPQGTVVYSTNPTQIGARYPTRVPFLEALAGEMVWDILVAPPLPIEPGTGRVLVAYAPLVWDPALGPEGVMEITLDIEAVLADIHLVRNIALLMVGGLLLLLAPGAYWMFWTAMRVVRRQRELLDQRVRELHALNRLLQQELAHDLELRDRIRRLRDEVAAAPSPANPDALLDQYHRLVVAIGELAGLADQIPRVVPEESRPSK